MDQPTRNVSHKPETFLSPFPFFPFLFSLSLSPSHSFPLTKTMYLLDLPSCQIQKESSLFFLISRVYVWDMNADIG